MAFSVTYNTTQSNYRSSPLVEYCKGLIEQPKTFCVQVSILFLSSVFYIFTDIQVYVNFILHVSRILSENFG